MIKTIGLIMIVTSCSMMGISLSSDLRRRSRALKAHISALQLIRTEILYKNTPLEMILAMLSDACGAQAAQFYQKTFAMAAQGMAFSTAAERHCQMLKKEGLTAEDIDVIRGACQVLGRYDSASQSERLQNAVRLLEGNLDELKGVLHAKGRIYRAVGATVGIVLALIVL